MGDSMKKRAIHAVHAMFEKVGATRDSCIDGIDAIMKKFGKYEEIVFQTFKKLMSEKFPKPKGK
ncbi:MAG: hypothetical protein COU07_00710 [Candidatus Harrisonbacteria bacterium CG10_big_fil_rev_8_21_14_0_10_40_38]|uniref:Uncharacterized protein n=1 Tax=Candidatus Harrisonbacteria bacterium CG10_big_fil_rev_8_21_14_0_10_40_38 TaxID=1974583 RepID=A0A2H0UUT2_9BACT|nr:MAG: hypothetical protein COU07_00710 [Candidatus Harrisonbacteria bacterium CG10_big_fil_rev_8_21_14_0_10_40_38]